MTINEKKMLVKSVQLSNYEMDTLHDAKKTLEMLFGRLMAKDNVNHVAAMITDLEQLLKELEENGNQIIEFNNMED